MVIQQVFFRASATAAPRDAGGMFLWRLCWLLAVLLLASAAVSWVAANWPYAAPWQKLLGVQLGLVGSAVLAGVGLYRHPDRRGSTALAPGLLALAAVMVGALFALIGQIYQTGADPWQLFLLWAVLLLPWCLATPSLWLQGLLSALLNTGLALYMTQAHAWTWATTAVALAVFNVMLLGLSEWRAAWLETYHRLMPRLLMLTALAWMLVAAVAHVDQNWSAVLVPSVLLWWGAGWCYQSYRRDPVMLSLLGTQAAVLLSIAIFDWLAFETALVVVAIGLLLALVWGGRYLSRQGLVQMLQPGEGRDPWFISTFRLVLTLLFVVACLLVADLVLHWQYHHFWLVGAGLAGLGLLAERRRSSHHWVADLAAAGVAVGVMMLGVAAHDWASGRLGLQMACVAGLLLVVLGGSRHQALRYFCAGVGLAVLSWLLWQCLHNLWGWPGNGGRGSHVPNYLLLALVGTLGLLAWHRLQGGAVAWALCLITLGLAWVTPALTWQGLVTDPYRLATGGLALYVVLMPVYALWRYAQQQGLKPAVWWGAGLVVLVASLGWAGAPGVAVALTWLLISRLAQRRVMLVAAGLALLIYLGQFYYQLDASLLHKAAVLGVTGAWLGAAALVLAQWGRLTAAASATPGKTQPRVVGSAHPLRTRLLLWVGLGLMGVLVVANASIWHHHRIVATGSPLVLQLVPVDPRSLMQGDYMALRFAVADQVQAALPSLSRQDAQQLRSDGGGLMQLQADAQGVHHVSAVLTRRQAASRPLVAGQVLLAFTLHADQVGVVTDAWFFAEGRAQHYDQARYGLVHADRQGRGRLVDMLDADLQPLSALAPP